MRALWVSDIHYSQELVVCSARIQGRARVAWGAMRMKNGFNLFFAISLWLLMAIGFSDNWLSDTAQKSNSQPKFLIHAFFAFWWFTLLVIQSGLIRSGNVNLHMRTGVVAMVAYVCMTITIWYMYLLNYLDSDNLLKLVKPLEVLSIVLVAAGYASRGKNSQRHREYLIFGAFCLIGPALDRTVFHIFGPEQAFYPALILYFVLFGAFIWSVKRFTWYMMLWIAFLAYSLFPMIESHFQQVPGTA